MKELKLVDNQKATPVALIRINLPADKALNNIDMGWLYRLINMKLSDRTLTEDDQRELRQLSSKLWALDNAMTAKGRL
jgi:hypothetical protein